MKPFSKLILFACVSAGLLTAGNQIMEARAGGFQTVFKARPSAVITQTPLSEVLLVNASHPLPEDYVPEGLVDLYGEKRSFQLATSDIRLARRLSRRPTGCLSRQSETA